MPFRSQAQRKKFYQLQKEGKISKKTVEEWEKATKKQKIAEKGEKAKEKVKLVKQVRRGCAPACIAMVLEKPYEEVLNDFHSDFLDEGQTLEETMDYLSDFGVSVIRKEVIYYCGNVKFGRDELLKPFAPIHIVRVKPKFDSSDGHLVVMNEKGELLCPDGSTDEEIRNSYVITTVLGLYK